MPRKCHSELWHPTGIVEKGRQQSTMLYLRGLVVALFLAISGVAEARHATTRIKAGTASFVGQKPTKQARRLTAHPLNVAFATRGGGDELEDKFGNWQVSFATLSAYAGCLALAGVTVGLVRKIPRSAGRAQPWLTQFIPEPVATAALHVGYLIHTLLVVKVLPTNFKDVLFSSSGITLLGTLFPVMESIRAATTETSFDDQLWLQYWIVHAAFSYAAEFIDRLAEKSPFLHQHWLPVHFYALLWLILPMTDGAAVVFEFVTKPYIVPIVKPIKEKFEGWLTTLALTLVNASYMWWFGMIFMALPVFLKRLAVIGTGTIFPMLGTIVAVAAPADKTNMRWLTYWSCFSLLFLVMSSIEKFVSDSRCPRISVTHRSPATRSDHSRDSTLSV